MADDAADVSTLIERGLDTGLPLAGPGAPLISDFAVMELSALLGRSLDSGRNYVGQVIELAHRLPRPGPGCWTVRCRCGRPCGSPTTPGSCPRTPRPSWTGSSLPMRTAAAGRRSTGSSRKHSSGSTPQRPRNDAGTRRTTATSTSASTSIGYDGIAHGTTALDAADALDLEQAIARRAQLNGQLGDTDSLDVRRAKALGEIAREDLALDLQVADPETGEITRTLPGRKTELILHLSATDQTVGRFGNTRTPISVEQIKTWLNLPNTSVVVRPVIDLNGDQPVDSYEIPDRIRFQVSERDHHCVFPYCHRPVESCDLDHIEPYADAARQRPGAATSRPCAQATTG